MSKIQNGLNTPFHSFIGYIIERFFAMTTQQMEAEADRLLGLKTGRRGRKRKAEYLVLSSRQLRTIAATELLLGDQKVSMFAQPGGMHQ